MRAICSWTILLVFVSTAEAGSWKVKNPDLPNGGMAVDISVNSSFGGQLDESAWHFVDVVSTGTGMVADGITVESEADVTLRDVGVSLMSAVSERLTVQVHYVYSRFLMENINYTRAGALEQPFLNDDGSYHRTADAHSLGVRFRLWLGTD